QRSFTDWKLKIFLAGSCLLLVSWMGAPSAEAQSGVNFSQATISGSILVEGMEQPAASVRVNIRPLTGGPPVTAYTDSSGRFEATGPDVQSYIVTVDERGYEPIEQRVDRTGAFSNVILTLKK